MPCGVRRAADRARPRVDARSTEYTVVIAGWFPVLDEAGKPVIEKSPWLMVELAQASGRLGLRERQAISDRARPGAPGLDRSSHARPQGLGAWQRRVRCPVDGGRRDRAGAAPARPRGSTLDARLVRRGGRGARRRLRARGRESQGRQRVIHSYLNIFEPRSHDLKGSSGLRVPRSADSWSWTGAKTSWKTRPRSCEA